MFLIQSILIFFSQNGRLFDENWKNQLMNEEGDEVKGTRSEFHNTTCCIHNCNNEGTIPLKNIEGKILVKHELIGTLPSSWLICEECFMKQLNKMTCCVIGCANKPEKYSLPASQLIRKKPSCSHYLICEYHYNEFYHNGLNGIKKDVLRLEIDSNKKDCKNEGEEMTGSKACCFGNCKENPSEVIEMLKPYNIFVCKTHYKILLKLLRKAILDKKMVLTTDQLNLLAHCDTIPHHPLANYNYNKKNDERCNFCFGYNNKKPIFICSCCSSVYCSECQKRLSSIVNSTLQQPSAHWKCIFCTQSIHNTAKEQLITNQIIKMLPVIKECVENFNKKEFVSLNTEIDNKRKLNELELEKKKSNIERFIRWFDKIFPLCMNVKLIYQDNGNKHYKHFWSQTLFNYFHATFSGTENHIGIKSYSFENVPVKTTPQTLDVLKYCHSNDYVNILKELFESSLETNSNKILWNVNSQLNSMLNNSSFTPSQYSLTQFYLKVTLEIVSGIEMMIV